MCAVLSPIESCTRCCGRPFIWWNRAWPRSPTWAGPCGTNWDVGLFLQGSSALRGSHRHSCLSRSGARPPLAIMSPKELRTGRGINPGAGHIRTRHEVLMNCSALTKAARCGDTTMEITFTRHCLALQNVVLWQYYLRTSGIISISTRGSADSRVSTLAAASHFMVAPLAETGAPWPILKRSAELRSYFR